MSQGPAAVAFDGTTRLSLDGQPVHTMMHIAAFAEYAIVTDACGSRSTRRLSALTPSFNKGETRQRLLRAPGVHRRYRSQPAISHSALRTLRLF